jgi:hypothetical protein
MKWSEFLAHEKWFKENMSPEEPIVFPRRTAKKRVANKEKRKRVIFDVTELGYSQFHADREAWMITLGENPSLFEEALHEAMKTFDLMGWLQKEDEDENSPNQQ